jgi:type IV fimbrial biogenesis protein FimT
MDIHGHGTGFTVLELMVTLAVAAVLLGLAIPAYETFINRQRMRAAVTGLHGDLLAARSQAVFQGIAVIACPGSPDDGCSGSNDWSAGWIVFEDHDGDREHDSGEPLRRRGSPPEAVAVFTPVSRTALRFLPDGSAPGSNVSISLCGRGGPARARKLVISNIGRIRRDDHPNVDEALCPG